MEALPAISVSGEVSASRHPQRGSPCQTTPTIAPSMPASSHHQKVQKLMEIPGDRGEWIHPKQEWL